jgi:hypothetical protein
VKHFVLSLAAVGLLAGGAGRTRAAPITHNIQNPQNLYGHLDQANVPLPPGGGGENSCVPTAVTNSFTYLQNAFSQVYHNLLTPNGAQAAATDLGANFMGSTSTAGTTGNNWINGTFNYVEAKAPNRTSYDAQFAAYGGALRFVQKINPTIGFLVSELAAGEDVEIGVIPLTGGIGHALTITGLSWVDTNGNGLLDGIERATLSGVDPAGGVDFNNLTLFPTDANGFIETNYFMRGMNADSTFALALAESPVPEPATVILLGIGAAGLVGYGWLPRKRCAA